MFVCTKGHLYVEGMRVIAVFKVHRSSAEGGYTYRCACKKVFMERCCAKAFLIFRIVVETDQTHAKPKMFCVWS